MNREPGHFYYDPEHELFLVIADVTDDSYTMAVHGWWELSDERIDEYTQSKKRELLTETELEEVIADNGSPDLAERFTELQALFREYENGLEDDAPYTEFMYDEDE